MRKLAFTKLLFTFATLAQTSVWPKTCSHLSVWRLGLPYIGLWGLISESSLAQQRYSKLHFAMFQVTESFVMQSKPRSTGLTMKIGDSSCCFYTDVHWLKTFTYILVARRVTVSSGCTLGPATWWSPMLLALLADVKARLEGSASLLLAEKEFSAWPQVTFWIDLIPNLISKESVWIWYPL